MLFWTVYHPQTISVSQCHSHTANIEYPFLSSINGPVSVSLKLGHYEYDQQKYILIANAITHFISINLFTFSVLCNGPIPQILVKRVTRKQELWILSSGRPLDLEVQWTSIGFGSPMDVHWTWCQSVKLSYGVQWIYRIHFCVQWTCPMDPVDVHWIHLSGSNGHIHQT